jgi:hypothetical protein
MARTYVAGEADQTRRNFHGKLEQLPAFKENVFMSRTPQTLLDVM